MILPKAITDTFPENWPAGLVDLAAPSTPIELSPEDTWALGYHSTYFRQAVEGAESRPFSDDMLAEIDSAMELYPQGVMPRIGLCSWKDSSPADLPSHGSRGVLHTITSNSERIGRALAGHVAAQTPAVLHLREWQDIPRNSEFRVFYRASRVIGASQYHCKETFSEMLADPDDLVRSLRHLLAKVSPFLPGENCVVDVCLRATDPFVIEVNPLIRQTDGCLFDWDNPNDFDGTLRLANHGEIVRLRPR